MNIINLLIINSNTNSKILSVHRQPTVYHMGRWAWITWVIFNSAVGRWPLGGGKQHLASRTVIGPGMAEPWTSSLLFVTLNIMELRSYYTHWKSIVVWHLRIWKDTLHTQSTNVNHLQCHIMVPPSFNQWDKIGTLQHFFLTISRMAM